MGVSRSAFHISTSLSPKHPIQVINCCTEERIASIEEGNDANVEGKECERDDNSGEEDTKEIGFFYDGAVDKDSNKLGLGGVALKRDGQVLV